MRETPIDETPRPGVDGPSAACSGLRARPDVAMLRALYPDLLDG
jgi:hypothetical protein